MKKNISALAFILLLITTFSCASDSESDLTIPAPILVKYNTDVRPIIQGNCIPCHTDPPVNGAPMKLTTYDDVKYAVNNRGLLDRISRQQGAPGMMPNGGTRLPQSKIDIIMKWKADGLLE
ncbi:hypothetical protein [Flavobacterium sp.]|uniref:hypothetical protein n=1 Tax=Flavobacterium sp. TaxID=239 RepID=UPI003D6B5261